MTNAEQNQPGQENYAKWGKCESCNTNLHYSRMRKSGSIELKCPGCGKWSSLNKRGTADRPRKPKKPYVHSKVNAPCECGVKPRKSGFIKGQQRLRCPECGRTWYDLGDDLPPAE